MCDWYHICTHLVFSNSIFDPSFANILLLGTALTSLRMGITTLHTKLAQLDHVHTVLLVVHRWSHSKTSIFEQADCEQHGLAVIPPSCSTSLR